MEKKTLGPEGNFKKVPTKIASLRQIKVKTIVAPVAGGPSSTHRFKIGDYVNKQRLKITWSADDPSEIEEISYMVIGEVWLLCFFRFYMRIFTFYFLNAFQSPKAISQSKGQPVGQHKCIRTNMHCTANLFFIIKMDSEHYIWSLQNALDVAKNLWTCSTERSARQNVQFRSHGNNSFN